MIIRQPTLTSVVAILQVSLGPLHGSGGCVDIAEESYVDGEGVYTGVDEGMGVEIEDEPGSDMGRVVAWIASAVLRSSHTRFVT